MALLPGMQRYRHDQMHSRPIDPSVAGFDEPRREVRFEIHLPVVFEPMDAIAHDALRPAGCHGAREMKFQFVAVAALESFLQRAVERQRATPATRRLDPFGLRQACRAYCAALLFVERLAAQRTI